MKEAEILVKEALAAIKDAADEQVLATLRVTYLGKKSELSRLSRTLGTLPVAERPQAGQAINDLRQGLTAAFDEKQSELNAQVIRARISTEKIDVSLPGRGQTGGALHPIILCIQKIEHFFQGFGFEIVEGPDIEDDFHNFEALNIPPEHPARAMHDTFYLQSGHLLRTHTSPVQIRVMQKRQPPLRMIAPGRVYRCDSDATHSPMFHQVEGLVVDTVISFADLKGIVQTFLSDFFDDTNLKIRFRPSYFPFTEPSAEVDILDRNGKWLEVMGCGMVHPNVFRAVDHDVQKWNGYAFGVGVERLAMLLYGIDDLRLFFDNDVRFIRQFTS